MNHTQTSLLPEYVPEGEQEQESKAITKRAMHNSKLFFSLLAQTEKNFNDEIDRLTVKSLVWRILDAFGIVPPRKSVRGYGSFVKRLDYFRFYPDSEHTSITVDYLIELGEWEQENERLHRRF